MPLVLHSNVKKREYSAMNVSLTQELAKFVNAKVETGRYSYASEVVGEALRLLEERDLARTTQLARFNRELGRSLDALDRGRHVDPSEARARLQRTSERRRKTKAFGASSARMPISISMKFGSTSPRTT